MRRLRVAGIAGVLAALAAALAFWALRGPAPRRVQARAVPLVVPSPTAHPLDRGENALWLSRHWLHEDVTDAELDALAGATQRLHITRLYPFLGPPGADGQRAGERTASFGLTTAPAPHASSGRSRRALRT
jgi:hypothetical protein